MQYVLLEGGIYMGTFLGMVAIFSIFTIIISFGYFIGGTMGLVLGLLITLGILFYMDYQTAHLDAQKCCERDLRYDSLDDVGKKNMLIATRKQIEAARMRLKFYIGFVVVGVVLMFVVLPGSLRTTSNDSNQNSRKKYNSITDYIKDQDPDLYDDMEERWNNLK